MEFKEPVLWDHQKEGVKRALAQGSYAFLYSPGIGKTLTTISTLRHIYGRHKRILRTLVVAPVIVLENWKDEWLKFSKIPETRLLVLKGSTKKRMQMLAQMNSCNNGEFIAITNYEGLVTNRQFFSDVLNWCPEVVVIDESQRIKSPSSRRTKLITEICDVACHRFLLTGTPILNSPLDIFAQWRALDGGESFGKNFYTFRAKYFYDKNSGMPKHVHFPKWSIRPEAYKQINRLIYKKAMRAVKSECLDLPPFVKQTIKVELPPKVRKMHDQMLNHFLTYVDDKAVTAEIALTKTLRMLQIVNGFVKDVDGKEVSIESPKKKALKELLGDICEHHKVLVWAVFKENYIQIKEVCDALKIKYVEAHGSIPNKAKYAAVDDFNNNPDIKVFLGHPSSLGIGINLVPASYSIYFSRTYNLEHDIQSEARNYRGGSEQHAKVTRIDLVSENSIDEVVMEALENKVGEATKIIDRVKKLVDSTPTVL